MTDHDLNNLKNLPVPPARRGAREAAVAVALQAFKTAQPRAAGDSQESSDESIRGSRRIHSRPRIAMAASLALIALAVPLVLHQLDTHSTNQLHPGPVPHPSKSDREITELQPGAADGQRNLSQIAATSGSPSEVARVPSSSLSLRDDAPVEVSRPADPSQQMARHFRLAELDPIRAPDVSARPRPEQGRERFDAVGPNPVKSVASEPISTFSIDVDTASYAFVRRALSQGLLPPKDAVRVEELINYFPYRYPLPEKREAPFQPTVTVLPSPWNPANKLVHIAVKGYDIVRTQRPRANLVLLIDTSGSMSPDDRLPLLKSAFRMLVDTLQPTDTVGIVTYAGPVLFWSRRRPRTRTKFFAPSIACTRRVPRPVLPASRRPIAWPRLHSTSRRSTASSWARMGTSTSGSRISPLSKATSSASATPASTCRFWASGVITTMTP